MVMVFSKLVESTSYLCIMIIDKLGYIHSNCHKKIYKIHNLIMWIFEITEISTWLPFQCNALTPHWLHEKKTTCVWKHVNLALLWNQILYEKTNTQLMQMHTFWHKSSDFSIWEKETGTSGREQRETKSGEGRHTQRGLGGGGGGGGERGSERQTKPKVKKDGDDTCRHTNKRGKMGKEGRLAEKEMGQRQGVCVGGFNWLTVWILLDQAEHNSIVGYDRLGCHRVRQQTALLLHLVRLKHKCVLKTASHPTQCFSHLSRHHKNAHGCNNKQWLQMYKSSTGLTQYPTSYTDWHW